MHRCFQLALLGSGQVAPNPMVGAVLVYQDKIIGEGFHQRFGEAHAEVNCINNVLQQDHHLVKESTLYVSLEPCTHFGKTPPCTDLIIKHEIKKVVIACTDPFSKVNGNGISKLKAAGIEVITEILQTGAIILNKRFFTFHNFKRPYIILKWTQSNNKKISEKNNRSYISNGYSNKLVHKWRSEEGAILIGTNTALQDDPLLTNRLWTGKSPLRIIIDKQLKIPITHNIYSDNEPLIIINYCKEEQNGNKQFLKASPSKNILELIMQILYERNINSLIVEGGSILLQSFIDSGLWDEARIITNTTLSIKNGIDAPVLRSGRLFEKLRLQNDEIDFVSNDTIIN